MDPQTSKYKNANTDKTANCIKLYIIMFWSVKPEVFNLTLIEEFLMEFNVDPHPAIIETDNANADIKANTHTDELTPVYKSGNIPRRIGETITKKMNPGERNIFLKKLSK